MSKKPGDWIVAACLQFACLASLSAQATNTPLPNSPSAQQQEEKHAEAERELHAEEQQRILKVIPNFQTVLNGRAVPLNAHEKVRLAIRNATDPFNFVAAFLLGGVDEVTDTRRGYHWGPTGYLKRAGANYADTADGAILGGAVYPILFHQDPRYFRKGVGTKRHRLRHALLATVICHSDRGTNQFNISNILGNFTAGAISNAYYPASDTGFALTIENASVVTLEGALGTTFLEFAPDVTTWLYNRRHPPPTP